MNVACFIYKITFYLAVSLTIVLTLLLSISIAISLSLMLSCQVHLLRTAGDEVTITVRYLREVPSFLKLPLGKSPVVWMPCNLTINFISLSIFSNKGTHLWEIVFLRALAL